MSGPAHPAAVKDEAIRRMAAGEPPLAVMADLGVARATIYAWRKDPSNETSKARKRRYRGTCAGCGGPTTGNDGPALAPTECASCFHARQHRERTWNRDTVIAAFRQYEARYGVPPRATDWNAALARRVGHPEYAERYERDGCWPSTVTVQREFGSWNAAVVAAGFEPMRPSQRRCDA